PYAPHLALLAWVWHRTVPAPRATGGARVRRRWRPTRPHIPPALRTLFLAAGLGGFLAWAVVGIYLALLPTLLGQTLHGDHPALTGGVLGSVLVRSVPALLAGARRTPYAAQRLGLAGLAGLAGSLLLPASTGASSLPATLGSTVLAGIGHGLAYSGAPRERSTHGHRPGSAPGSGPPRTCSSTGGPGRPRSPSGC
ncbi:hypothetical protein ACFYOY_47600, partial [Streptomyces sp. NPDC007875]